MTKPIDNVDKPTDKLTDKVTCSRCGADSEEHRCWYEQGMEVKCPDICTCCEKCSDECAEFI